MYRLFFLLVTLTTEGRRARTHLHLKWHQAFKEHEDSHPVRWRNLTALATWHQYTANKEFGCALLLCKQAAMRLIICMKHCTEPLCQSSKLSQPVTNTNFAATLQGSGQTQTQSVPLDKVIDDIVNMGFSRHEVRGVVTKLMESGQSIDLNIVLDRLMNGMR